MPLDRTARNTDASHARTTPQGDFHSICDTTAYICLADWKSQTSPHGNPQSEKPVTILMLMQRMVVIFGTLPLRLTSDVHRANADQI